MGTENRDIAISTPPVIAGGYYRVYSAIGDKRYELSNHLNSILNIITDRKLPINNPQNNKVDYYTADVVAYNDYMPFGALMEGRHGYEGKKHAFGFQGQLTDDEIKGEGNSYTTAFRQLDPRLGRWLSIDPKETAWESPCLSIGDNPIMYSDSKGDSVQTLFLDKNGFKTNEIPEAVQNMFQQEYGITLGYENGMLFKKDDFKTSQSVSPTAKEDWESVLGQYNIEQGLAFGYNIVQETFQGYKNQPFTRAGIVKGSMERNVAIIDLADYNSDGNVKSGWSTTENAAGILRADNLARTIEHEFIGHGLRGETDDFNSELCNPDLGGVETMLNIYREEMGLPLRVSYEYFYDENRSSDEKPSKTHTVSKQYVFSDGSTGCLYYDRKTLEFRGGVTNNYIFSFFK